MKKALHQIFDLPSWQVISAEGTSPGMTYGEACDIAEGIGGRVVFAPAPMTDKLRGDIAFVALLVLNAAIVVAVVSLCLKFPPQ